ncbi:MAG: C39 family peptidase [Euryarchaeota archaeon]|nr:C39 family peptidase [Euryarchaeota archaeon]
MKKKFVLSVLLATMMLMSMILLPVSAQEEKDYSVTAEEAFEHANAHMISFIAGNAPGFENWAGASIDPKPQELYDINGQKLFYQFSVYKENKLIGTIDVCADKMLGPSIYDIKFDPKPYKAAEAMKKSKGIANDKYPTGEIKSTFMVVYSYPKVGAMTIIKDKATGDEHRIFVDAYTLDEVQDKPINETNFGDLGVWSIYEQRLKNGVGKNLKEWQKSDNFTKSIEQAITNKGVNSNVAITEENIKILSGDAAIMAITSGYVSVPIYTQETTYYCVPTSIQMLCEYFNIPTSTPSQTYIYNYLDGPPYGLSYDDIEEWVEDVWGKTPTVRTTALYNIDVVTEIDNERPFFSMVSGHCRICRGYLNQGGYFYMYINDPEDGNVYYECTYGGPEIGRVYVR